MILKQLRKETSLPYVAFHSRFEIHPKLLNAFGLKKGDAKIAMAGWSKHTRLAVDINKITRKVVSFETQQHLGYLRIF